MTRIRVTKTRSTLKKLPKQVNIMEALGLRKMNSSREFDHSPSIAGMVDKVKHLVKVENI